MPRLTWATIFLFVLPRVAGMMGTHHCPQPLIKMGGLMSFLPEQASKCNIPDLCLPNT
jgi:hypothetical protein